MNPPSFDTWQYENLVKFAQEAYERLREQAMIIEQLRIELKETRNDKFH